MSICGRFPVIRAVRPGILLLVLLIALPVPVAMADSPSLLRDLEGEPRPGALLIGRTLPGVEVLLEDRSLQVDDEGYFVFGFGRDEKGEALLRFRKEGREEQVRLALAEREWDIQHVDGAPPETVTPPEERLERIRAEARKVGEARSTESARRDFRQGFEWPVTGRITGVYGSQRVFDGQPRRPHYGVDIAAPEGTPVQAPAGGRVTLVHDDMFFSGGTLIVDHGFGVSSTYLHLSEIHVREGQEVERGEEIARVGATGRATGPHLCWRINWYQERLDPQTLVGEMPRQ